MFANRILHVPEVSYILRISGSMVCKLIALGLLSARKKGREWEITEASVYKYIDYRWPKTIIDDQSSTSHNSKD